MASRDSYRLWLSSGQTNRQVVETLQIFHPAWANIHIANNDRSVTAQKENGQMATFMAGRFYMEPASITDTTSQTTNVTVASLDGLFYDKIKDMSFSDRETPIILTHRLYFLDNPAGGLLINPPPKWTVHGIEATREAIKVEIRAEALRVKRIGLYYTAREFPALVYL